MKFGPGKTLKNLGEGKQALPCSLLDMSVGFCFFLCTGNIMTLSYNVGLTTGSATAYLLNYLLGSTPAVSCVSPITANISQVPG